MKNLFFFLCLFASQLGWSQMGQVWPVEQRQDYDMNDKLEVTKTYDATTVCQFFMFINNNEFIHVTDNITSLYKIIKRNNDKPNEPVYTVISEAGNEYIYIFNKEKKDVTAYSTKGFAIVFSCITPHETKVFSNFNR